MFFCCCGTCDLCLDSFDRADDTDISTGSPCTWTEAAGDWSIASNKLTVSSAVARAMTSISATYFRARVTVATNGTQYRIYYGYVDANNYWYLQVTSTATSIVRRVSGANSTVASASIGGLPNPLTIDFCTSPDGHRAVVNANNVVWPGAPPTGLIGLGTGTVTGSTTFEDLEITSTDSPCPACVVPDPCQCCDRPVQAFLVDLTAVALTNAACGTCVDIDDTYVVDPTPVLACSYSYTDFGFCSSYQLGVGVSIQTFGGQCRLLASFGLSGGPLGTMRWQYRNDYGDFDSDCDGPWVLPLLLAEPIPALCDGTVPATITVSRLP